MRWLASVGVVLAMAGCRQPAADSPVKREEATAAKDARVAVDAALAHDPTSAGCMMVPQPMNPANAGKYAAPPPEDMVCMHGDGAYSCPASFEPLADQWHCQRSSRHRDTWCCPLAMP